MSEPKTRRYLREIREHYHAAVIDWSNCDNVMMILHLEAAIRKSQELVELRKQFLTLTK